MTELLLRKWELFQEPLKERLRFTPQKEYYTYEALLKIVLEEVNKVGTANYGEIFNVDAIKTIDYGDYQGTLIIIFPVNTYQPSVNETYYTVVEYGSCSVCDTLMSISNGAMGLPTEEQVKDYMTLCLHLLQRTKCFVENEL